MEAWVDISRSDSGDENPAEEKSIDLDNLKGVEEWRLQDIESVSGDEGSASANSEREAKDVITAL